VHSPPAIACSDGYPALLRLLWATGTAASGGRFPSSVRGESPPDLFEAPVAPSLHRPLNAFLAGTSDRLTGELERLVSSCDAYLQPALRRDCVAAARFFTFGPRAIRDLRLRHGVRRRVLLRADVERLIRAEVEAAVGPFAVLAEDDTVRTLLGTRRARGRTIRRALRQLEAAADSD